MGEINGDFTAEGAESAENDLRDLTREIIGGAIGVHRELGPGLLESTYEICLSRELHERGLRVERQKTLPIVYRGYRVDGAYRIDLLIEKLVVVEVKTVARLDPVHHAQLLTYLKLSKCPVGLLINFNVPRLKQGIKRMVYGPSDVPLRPPRPLR